jgi:hypothetical protein
MPTFPEWWNWDLSFTGHAEFAHGATRGDRGGRPRYAGASHQVRRREGRFMIQTRRGQSPWVVIVEPDAEARLLVVVTVYEVSQ